MRRLETFDWWPRLVARKDDLSLRELAEVFSVTPGAISAALKRQGVTRKPAPPGPRANRRRARESDLPPEPGDMPGPTDSRVAERRLVRPDVSREQAMDDAAAEEARQGSKDHLILGFRDLIGTMPDHEVAARAGVSVRTLSAYRARNNIAAFQSAQGKPAGRRRSRIEPFIDRLGTVPDRVVAESAGVTINAVRNYRVKHGVAAFGGYRAVSGEASAEAVASSVQAIAVQSPTSVGSGRQAYRVTFAGQAPEGIVVAADLAAAAAAASRVGPAVSVEYLGSVL